MALERKAGVVSFSPMAIGGATATFTLIGAIAALYGPLLVSFTHRFQVSLPTAGVTLSVHFTGSFLGVTVGWWALRRVSGRWVLTAALVVFSAGATLVALSARWPMFLAGVSVIGVGFGVLDFSLNALLARTTFGGRAARLSITNAGYGVGAVIGPLLVILISPAAYPPLFAGIAAVGLVLSTLNRGVVASPELSVVARDDSSGIRADRRQILVTFVAGYVLYVAVETSASGWMATQLRVVGYGQATGSLVTAGFWAGMAIGRLAVVPLYHRLSARQLVLGGLAVAIAVTSCAYSSGLAPYAYPLTGLALAAVFPMGLVWFTVLSPDDSGGVSWLLLGTMAGGVLGPAVESLLVSALGLHVVPLVVVALAVIDLAVFASALRFPTQCPP